MLDCLKFILSQVINFVSILFTVNVGFTNLGVVFCIVYILFPIVLAVVNFIKTTFVEELDERYDYEKPITTSSYQTTASHTINGVKKSHTMFYTKRKRGYRK